MHPVSLRLHSTGQVGRKRGGVSIRTKRCREAGKYSQYIVAPGGGQSGGVLRAMMRRSTPSGETSREYLETDKGICGEVYAARLNMHSKMDSE